MDCPWHVTTTCVSNFSWQTHTLHPPTATIIKPILIIPVPNVPHWGHSFKFCFISFPINNIGGNFTPDISAPSCPSCNLKSQRTVWKTNVFVHLVSTELTSAFFCCLPLCLSLLMTARSGGWEAGGMNEWSVVFGHRATSAGELEKFYIWWIKSLWWSCVNFVMITFISCYEGIKVKRKL